jgi:hypothetical protein
MYGLDPNYYYTAPGYSFDAMLKLTEVELEILSDYDQILIMEAGIRGGLTQASKRYAQANNSEILDYDPSKPDSWITYLNATNLYVFSNIIMLIYIITIRGWFKYDRDKRCK